MPSATSRTHGIVHTERTPDFGERRASSELVLRLHEILRGPKTSIREPDPFASNIKPDPFLESFSKLDPIDRNLIREANELFLEVIEDRKQQISEKKYGLGLKELEAQLYEEAATQVTVEFFPRGSEELLKEDTAEGHGSSPAGGNDS